MNMQMLQQLLFNS